MKGDTSFPVLPQIALFMPSIESTPLTLVETARVADLLNLIINFSSSNYLMVEFCGKGSPVSHPAVSMDLAFALYVEPDVRESLWVIGPQTDVFAYHRRNILNLMSPAYTRFIRELSDAQERHEWDHLVVRPNRIGTQLPLCTVVAGTYTDDLSGTQGNVAYYLFYAPELTAEPALARVQAALKNYKPANIVTFPSVAAGVNYYK